MKYNGQIHFLELQRRAIERIRKIDPDVPIIVASTKHDYSNMKPFLYSNIIYTLHYYNPGTYTHQGVNSNPVGYEYPGNYSNVWWNKTQIIKDISGFYNFTKKYNAKGYIGEFSAIRWAKGNTQYISDLIDIFEDYG